MTYFRLVLFFSLSYFLGTLETSVYAQVLGSPRVSVRPADRVTRVIDDQARVVRLGNRHPWARPEFDRGLASPETRMDRMVLLLAPDATQQKALEDLLEAQQDPSSPDYHRFLTPEAFGQRFGASENDVARITGWLRAHGFQVEPVDAGRRQIVFSGTAGEVQSAFHTEMHVYGVNGESHYANASDPEIPEAIAAVVSGVVSLHDFRSQPAHNLAARAEAPAPEFTSGASHYMAPADFATIYDAAALYSQSIDGTGQSIAVVGRSNFKMADQQTFRSTFGLPANNPSVIVNGTDPGIVSSDEQMEATLDVSWAGAVAKNASIQFVVSASTNTTDGVTLSAQYIVNHNVAPVMSLSFGNCEAAIGAAGNQFWNALWQQAAAQGMTVLVASGDSGAAGCNDPSSSSGSSAGVNGLCSSPYSTCVGGTQFADTANPNAYWSATNTSGTFASALSYIPEQAWNSSATVAGGSGLWASGGGPSRVYPKPSWQSAPGVPSDGWRDVPDVSLNSSGHDGYLLAMNGQYYVVSGTSAAAPSFAGLVALTIQKTAAHQGNINPTLYSLASQQANGGAAVFHDVTVGNNSVPGVTGFIAGAGYDLATGLGSVDAANLVNHWSDTTVPTPGFQLNANHAISVLQGSNASLTLTTTVSGGFNSSVALSIASLPTGLTATFTPSIITAPGSGSATLKLVAAQTLAVSTYNLTITASGGSITHTLPLAVSITAPVQQPPFSLNATSASFGSAGGNGTISVTANVSTAQWTAVSNATWISITNGGSHTGSQQVAYTVAPNSSSTPRSGTITVAGLTFTVSEGGLTCSYRIAIGPVTSTPAGSAGSVAVTAAAGCSWTASSNASWLTISSGSTGNGNGTVLFLAAKNTSPASRSAILSVAGYAIQVNEQGTSRSAAGTPESISQLRIRRAVTR